MSRRLDVFATASVVAALLAGCGSDEKPPPPQVTLKSQVTPGDNCKATGEFFFIGSFGNPARSEAVRPVPDGTAEQQGEVHISCRVAAEGGGFAVATSTELTGATGGYFTMSGFFRPEGDQSNIQVGLSSQKGKYVQKDCTVQYTGEGIKPGRIWGVAKCPKAVDSSVQIGDKDVSCNAEITFRFENCTQ